MPLVPQSGFRPAWWARHPHLQTALPTLWRRVALPMPYRRERIGLPDDDFLDVDWLGDTTGQPEGAALLLHGLEGCSRTPYMLGLARALFHEGWRVGAINFRGCSGEPNRLPRSYHSGATEDLRAVLERSHSLADPTLPIVLAGFSLGGNLLLKYLGEAPPDPRIRAAAAVSVPCDLAESAGRLAEPANRIYMRRFLRYLYQKIRDKNRSLGTDFDEASFRRMRTFNEFDGAYTAPEHGFESAEAYWSACSANRFLEGIRTPTLLVQAADDPFLGPRCYPAGIAEDHKALHLEMPTHGGHVGFMECLRAPGPWWVERRLVQFFNHRF
ncbi:MAG: YheT family hydrolase [Opitutales bacterium]